MRRSSKDRPSPPLSEPNGKINPHHATPTVSNTGNAKMAICRAFRWAVLGSNQ